MNPCEGGDYGYASRLNGGGESGGWPYSVAWISPEACGASNPCSNRGGAANPVFMHERVGYLPERGPTHQVL